MGFKSPAFVPRYIQALRQLSVDFEYSELRTLCVNDKQGIKFGFIFGMGVVPAFLNEFYTKTDKSFIGFAKIMLSGVLSYLLSNKLHKPLLRKMEVDLYLENFSDNIDVIVSSAEDFRVYGLKPFKNPKLIKVGYGSLVKAGSAFRVLWSAFSGKNYCKQGFNLISVNEFEVYIREPEPYTLDGELYIAQPGILRVCLGPKIEIPKI